MSDTQTKDDAKSAKDQSVEDKAASGQTLTEGEVEELAKDNELGGSAAGNPNLPTTEEINARGPGARTDVPTADPAYQPHPSDNPVPQSDAYMEGPGGQRIAVEAGAQPHVLDPAVQNDSGHPERALDNQKSD